MTPDAVGLRIRWRAAVQSFDALDPSKRWVAQPDERAVVLHVVTDRAGRWKFAALVELIGEMVIGEYLTARTPADMTLARRYVSCHRAATAPGLADRIPVLSSAQFGRKVTNLGYRSGWPLVGIDLPWQLSRLAERTAPARRARYGSHHVFVLGQPGCGAPSRQTPGRWRDSYFRPRLFMDPRGPGHTGAFFSWETPVDHRSRRRDGDRARRGRFVDVAVIAGALAGRQVERVHDVAGLFGLAWPDGRSSGIDRLRAETSAVTEIYRAERRLLATLGVAPWRAWSAGSLVAAALDATGADPPAAKLEVPPDLLGAMSAAMLGGDTAYRLTNEVVPALLVDRNGDYVRCYSALGLQRLLTCARITVEPVDLAWLTEQVSTLEPDLKALGLVFALARFNGETASSRVELRPGSGEYAVRTGPLHFDGPWPCHALDLARSWASCGRVPEVMRSWRLVPEGEHTRLQPVALPTGRLVDLRHEDLARALLEERLRVDRDASLPEHEHQRLRGCLKLWANSFSFGLAARHDRSRLSKPVTVSVLDLFGASRAILTDEPELPARWTFMPGAAAVSACSRFLTARLIAQVEATGGTWVATAVDSVAVVAASSEEKVHVTGGPVLAVSFDRLRALLDEDDRYLEVADSEPPVWKVEADGFARPTLAYCAGANKLFLLRRKAGRLCVVRSTDTALGGHLAEPAGRGEVMLDDGHHAWPLPLLGALAQSAEDFRDATGWPPLRFPAWSERPVVRRLRVTSSAQLRRLRRAFPDADVRPWDRYLRVEAGEPGDDRVAYSLAADISPRGWLDLEWRLRSGKRVEVTTELLHPPGMLWLRTVREHLIAWRLGHDIDRELPADGDQGTWPFPRRGLRSPAAVHSSLSLVELCGRDGALLDLAEYEPDGDLDHAVASYGPAVERLCAWPDCTTIVGGGRGSDSRWCAAHRARSGRDRAASNIPPHGGCEVCGVVLSARANRRFCRDCAIERKRERDAIWRAKTRASSRQLEPP